MTDRLNILITSIGSSNGRAIAKIILERFPAFNIFTTDINSLDHLTPVIGVKKSFQVPLAKDSEYITSLLKICREYQIHHIIPIHDIEVIEIGKFRNEFENVNTKLYLPSNETLKICRDKYRFYQFGKKNDIAVIESSLNPEFDYPCIIKPREGNASVHCYRIDDKDELKVFSRKTPNAMFQEFCHGYIVAIDFICNRDSEIVSLLARKELQVKAGVGVKVEIIKDEKINSMVIDLLKKLRFIGIGGVEIFVDQNNYKILELNSRPSSGSIFSWMAGEDILGHYFKSAGYQNIEIEKKKIKYGAKMNRELVAFEI